MEVLLLGLFSRCAVWASGTWASVVVAHGLSCSVACGIFPDQGVNCLSPVSVDSLPQSHQGSPRESS